MARDWTSRQPPAKSSITEVARRYHACALALAQTLGLTLQEVLTQHRESVTAVFIESSKCELRLSASVTLPPVVSAVKEPRSRDASAQAGPGPQGFRSSGEQNPTGEPPVHGEPPLPAVIPAGLPCAGQKIAQLKPAQLAMVVSKVATLAHAEGERWAGLLHALQLERARRVEAGRQRRGGPGSHNV
jgi:hypothetical protein